VRLTAPTALLGALGVVALLGPVACDTDGDEWDPDAQFAPSLRPAIGVRADDGDLLLWTGTPCRRVTRVALTFDLPGEDSARWELTSRRPGGAVLERFRLDRPPRGFRVSEQLPVGFDWEDADRVAFTGDGAGGVWGTNTDLDVIRAESADQADDDYWFDQVGWLDAEGVAEGNSEEFLTPCTPDPAG
jgi:hypothetical protein